MTKERVNEIGKVNDFATWLVENINSKEFEDNDIAWEALEELEEAVYDYFATAHNFQLYTATEDIEKAEYYGKNVTEDWEHLQRVCAEYEADILEVVMYFTVFSATK